MKLQGPNIKKVDPDGKGSYDIVTVMNVIGIEDELSPPETIEVNDIKFSRSVVIVDDEDENLFWSYWNDDVPVINLQLWFS
jgi:hypothetical protein